MCMKINLADIFYKLFECLLVFRALAEQMPTSIIHVLVFSIGIMYMYMYMMYITDILFPKSPASCGFEGKTRQSSLFLQNLTGEKNFLIKKIVILHLISMFIMQNDSLKKQSSFVCAMIDEIKQYWSWL